MAGQHHAVALKIKREGQRLRQEAVIIANIQIPLKHIHGRLAVQFLHAELSVHLRNRHKAAQRFPAKTRTGLHMKLFPAEYGHSYAVAKQRILCKDHAILPQTAVVRKTAKKKNLPARPGRLTKKRVDIEMKSRRNNLHRRNMTIRIQNRKQTASGSLTVLHPKIKRHDPHRGTFHQRKIDNNIVLDQTSVDDLYGRHRANDLRLRKRRTNHLLHILQHRRIRPIHKDRDEYARQGLHLLCFLTDLLNIGQQFFSSMYQKRELLHNLSILIVL